MQAGSQAKIGPVMGTFLVATTMIGSGIYMLPATVAAVGSISVIGWVIAAIGAMLTGLTLAFLARVEPGGCFLDSVAQQLGPIVGLVTTILFIVSFLLSLPMVAVAAAGYTGFIFPALATPDALLLVTIAYIWVFVGVSWQGARLIAGIGSFTLIIGLVPLILVATLGWGQFDAEIFRSSWNISARSDASAALYATLILFMAYLGLETASIVSAQMRNPRRDVPISTVAGIVFATIVYISSTTVVSGLIPAATLAKSSAPFADATAVILGSIAALLVAICAMAKAAGTLGSLQLSTVESIVVLKHQFTGGDLSRGGTNVVVGVIATAIAYFTASPNLASQFGVLATAMVSIAMLTFILGGIALAKARGGIPRLTAIATVLFSIGLLAAQPPKDMAIAAMLVVGTAILCAVLLFWRRRRTTSPA